MAMHVPNAPGFAQMMKEGAQHFSGLEEAVIRNINACVELSKTTQTTFGPNGQNKMIINHLDKLFVTSDAATILRELEVEHPAAKMLVFASHQQEQECGDGTNAVVIFAGALLEGAAELIKMGLSVVEIADGYTIACSKALEFLPKLQVRELKDLTNKEEILPVIRSAIMSKQYGYEDFLGELITKACLSVVSTTGNFNVDNIRVCKIPGQSVLSSSVISGMLFKRPCEGVVKKALNAKVAVYTCPLDMLQTETKGTVLIKNAHELLDYTKGEEAQVEEHIKSIAATGVTVIVAGGKCGDLYVHYCNKYKLMVIRLMSKFDLRRLCKSINATPLPRLTAPTAEEMGYCDDIRLDEIGDTSIIVFNQEKKESCIATILLRGSTDNVLDDIERCVDDGVNTYKSLTKNKHLLAGAGATEIELAKQIMSYGEKCPGLEQYAIKKFAESLESIPTAIAINTGLKGTDMISKLYAAHENGEKYAAVNIESEDVSSVNAVDKHILDLYITKHWMLKFATQAASTVLKVDQIIMAKRAGGPKAKSGPNNMDNADDE